jgi:hypothetical protein
MTSRPFTTKFSNPLTIEISQNKNKLLLSNIYCSPTLTQEPLVHIFSLSVENDIFLTHLKSSRTVPISKSGDVSNCDNYRPISLITTISKVLEKIVAVKLTNHLELNKLLHKHQFGFQRSLSTEHNLIQVVKFI